MEQLFSQLGIDWHLLLSQAVNFFLLLIVLRVFAYKPLLAFLHERRRKIEEGLAKAAGTGTIGKVESLTKKGKLVAYEAIVQKGKKHSEVQVGPDGKKLAHSE